MRKLSMEEGTEVRSDHMLLTSKDSIDIYKIGGSSSPARIDISDTEKLEVVGDRVLLFYLDYLDIYDFSAAQLNDNYSINIEDAVVKPYKKRFFIFGAENDVKIYGWDGKLITEINTHPWVKADVIGDHVFIVFDNDIETYDLDGSNKHTINLPVIKVELLENRIINLISDEGTIYTWNSEEEEWESSYFESPNSDYLEVIGSWIIGVSESKLRFFNLDGEPVGDEYDLWAQFNKENVIFP